MARLLPWIQFRSVTGSTQHAPHEPRPATPELIDAETKLPNHVELERVLTREIARCDRYGSKMTLVIFDACVAAYRPTPEHPLPPSPARHIAKTLMQAIRASDLVARLSETRFAVVLTECDDAGAAGFADRTRTKLSSAPYVRGPDREGIYLQTWAGFARWTPQYTTPAAYIAAVVERLEATFIGYRAAQLFFRGD